MRFPLIGITPDRDAPAGNIESHYFVRRNYCQAVIDSGGLPVILPYAPALVDAYLDLLDGLLISGGMFDIAPEAYGQAARYPDQITLKDDRTAFERALLRGALARDLPVLGVCGGMQLIAVEMGAALLQHLPHDVGAAIEHKQSTPCSGDAHHIRIIPGSRLHQVLGVESLRVNSLHHQAVAAATPRLGIGAQADDGVIEAIEVPEQRFCLGVQWHPEYLVNAAERRLFAGLIQAATAAPL